MYGKLLGVVGVIAVIVFAATSAVKPNPPSGPTTPQPNSIRAYHAHMVLPEKFGGATLCVVIGPHHEFQEIIRCTERAESAIYLDSLNYFGGVYSSRVTPEKAEAVGYDMDAEQCFILLPHSETPHYIPGPCDPKMRRAATYAIRG